MFKTDLRKKSHEIRPIKYGHDMKYLLNAVQWEIYEKCFLKPGLSNIVLRFSIYKQRSNRTKPKIVFRKRSHEIGFIKYGLDMSCL